MQCACINKSCTVQTCHLTWSLSSFPKHLIKSDYLSLGEMTNPSSPNRWYLMPLLDKHWHLTFDSLFYLRIKKRRFFSQEFFSFHFSKEAIPQKPFVQSLAKPAPQSVKGTLNNPRTSSFLPAQTSRHVCGCTHLLLEAKVKSVHINASTHSQVVSAKKCTLLSALVMHTKVNILKFTSTSQKKNKTENKSIPFPYHCRRCLALAKWEISSLILSYF